MLKIGFTMAFKRTHTHLVYDGTRLKQWRLYRDDTEVELGHDYELKPVKESTKRVAFKGEQEIIKHIEKVSHI